MKNRERSRTRKVRILGWNGSVSEHPTISEIIAAPDFPHEERQLLQLAHPLEADTQVVEPATVKADEDEVDSVGDEDVVIEDEEEAWEVDVVVSKPRATASRSLRTPSPSPARTCLREEQIDIAGAKVEASTSLATRHREGKLMYTTFGAMVTKANTRYLPQRLSSRTRCLGERHVHLGVGILCGNAGTEHLRLLWAYYSSKAV